MKKTLLVVTLGAILACPALAQPASTTASGTPPTSPAGGPPHGGRMGFLTPEEREELKAAHEAAAKANPNLETQRKALQDQLDANRKQMDAAMLQIDPKVAPILAKLEAHKPPHDGAGGPPPPPAGQ